MAFYDDMADVVTDLLTEFGLTMTITRVTGEVRNPTTFVVTPGSSATYSPKGLIKPYLADQIDGTLIKKEDRMIILDDTVQPLLTDKITTNAESWSIVSIATIKPDDAAVVVHFCQARK